MSIESPVLNPPPPEPKKSAPVISRRSIEVQESSQKMPMPSRKLALPLKPDPERPWTRWPGMLTISVSKPLPPFTSIVSPLFIVGDGFWMVMTSSPPSALTTSCGLLGSLVRLSGPSVPVAMVYSVCSSFLENEVGGGAERRLPLQGEQDDEVGGAVAVGVALEKPVRPAHLLRPQFARLVAEGVGADPLEVLVAEGGRVGVDPAQVDLVGARREVEDVVAHRVGRFRGA